MKIKFFIIVFVLTKLNLMAQTFKHIVANHTNTLISNYYTITGNVMQTYDYCGGARPSKEMLEEMAKPKPYIGKTFYVKNGKLNTLKQKIILSFKVDSLGNFSFNLPNGIYTIIQQQQIKALNTNDYQKQEYIKADATCLKTWWAKPYYILEVKDKNISNLDFKFHRPCFVSGDVPCLQYVGPMPQ